MKNILVISILAFSALMILAFVHPTESVKADWQTNFNPNWAMQSLWDDGLAEVNSYNAERKIYGKTRTFEYTHIAVKEVFNSAFDVKTDDYSRDDLFDVFKVNKIARIETDKYPYHFLSSLFFQRTSPERLYKFTNSSQEWCGNTFKSWSYKDNAYNINYDSYWDGEGIGSKKVNSNFLFEDQLSFSLRALNFKQGLRFQAPLLSTQVSSRLGSLSPQTASFIVREIDYENEKAWEVTVQLDMERKNKYIFKQDYPNQLLKQNSWDGRNLMLIESKRDAYWRF